MDQPTSPWIDARTSPPPDRHHPIWYIRNGVKKFTIKPLKDHTGVTWWMPAEIKDAPEMPKDQAMKDQSAFEYWAGLPGLALLSDAWHAALKWERESIAKIINDDSTHGTIQNILARIKS